VNGMMKRNPDKFLRSSLTPGRKQEMLPQSITHTPMLND
jgi:hypothetical protein